MLPEDGLNTRAQLGIGDLPGAGPGGVMVAAARQAQRLADEAHAVPRGSVDALDHGA